MKNINLKTNRSWSHEKRELRSQSNNDKIQELSRAGAMFMKRRAREPELCRFFDRSAALVVTSLQKNSYTKVLGFLKIEPRRLSASSDGLNSSPTQQVMTGKNLWLSSP